MRTFIFNLPLFIKVLLVKKILRWHFSSYAPTKNTFMSVNLPLLEKEVYVSKYINTVIIKKYDLKHTTEVV